MLAASTRTALLCKQLPRRKTGDSILGGTGFVDMENADTSGSHGLNGTGTHTPHDHCLAIVKEACETSVIVVMDLFLTVSFNVAVTALTRILGLVLIVVSEFPRLDCATLSLKHQEGPALTEVRGYRMAVHGRNGDLHGVSS